MAREPLLEPEMIEILEDIARTASNGAARIAAIKQLREMRSDVDSEPAAPLSRIDELARLRVA